jgi:hypothetical protein
MVRGTITYVGERYSGNSSKTGEPWSLQNITIKDTTGEFRLVAKDRDAIPGTWKGKEFVIYCNEGEKGLTGLKIKEDKDKKGNVRNVLWFTGSGHIEEATDSAPQASAPAAGQAPRAQAAPAAINTPPAAPAQQDGMTEAQRLLAARKGGTTTAQVPPVTPAVPPQSKTFVPLGATVGMAINNACASLTARGIALNPTLIVETASDILRASRWLEAGNLAPKWSERYPAKSSPQVPTAPEPVPADGQDDDIPF